MIKEYVNNPNNPRLTSIQDVAQLITAQQNEYNLKATPKHTIQIILDIEKNPTDLKVFNITNFKREYYSFKMESNSIVASVLTGGPIVKKWPNKIIIQSCKSMCES